MNEHPGVRDTTAVARTSDNEANILSRHGAAFTLIELLVVIAIIAILAAILFPVFAQARDKARSAACLSNMKQLGLAVAQYEQDFDETVPCGINGYGGGNGWAGQIYPYVKSVAVFQCPSDATVDSYYTTNGHVTSYGYNRNMAPLTKSPIALASYTSPARTILFFEVTRSTGFDITIGPTSTNTASDDYFPWGGGSAVGWGTGGGWEPAGYNAQASVGTPNDGHVKYATGYFRGVTGTYTGSFYAPTGRHNGGSVFLMADTHAKFYLANMVSPGATNGTPGNCGAWKSGWNATAASTDCGDSTIAATFSVK